MNGKRGPAERGAKSILLKNVVPIGFGNRDVNGKSLDIAVDSKGIVALVGENLGPEVCEDCLDLKGHYISPGWIDLHTHLFEAGKYGIDPDLAGPDFGVTIPVDAGSAGEATFRGFRKYVIDRKAYPIRAFLNVSSYGITGVYSNEVINHQSSALCVEKNRDVIKGIKVLASKQYVRDGWIYPVMAAKRLAVDLDLPLMVHIGEPPVYIDELVGNILDSGDIITHCFTGKVGNSVRSSPSRVIALYREAHEKGILLDIGHGVASFSFESARGAIEQGIKPHTISTDLHSMNVKGPVWSLAAVMSKMLACALSLEEVVEMVTLNPATVLKETEYGTLERGAAVNFTVFDLAEGSYTFTDASEDTDAAASNEESWTKFAGDTFVRPRYVLLGNALTEAKAAGLEENRGP
jgi:dihydroorotase